VPEAGAPGELFPCVGNGTIRFGLALAALALDARGGSVPTAAEIRTIVAAMRQALRISNDESDELEGALSFGHLLAETAPSVATMKRFLARPTSAAARSLMAALAQTGRLSDRIGLVLERLRELEKTNFAPPPLITGDDLTAAGLTPGKLFKRILDETYDAQLEDRIRSKQEAMEMAKKIAGEAK
jgi:hypothetical protein